MTLEDLLRRLLATAAQLGHAGATLGIPLDQLERDVAHGPEADQLLAKLTPLIRTAARQDPRP